MKKSEPSKAGLRFAVCLAGVLLLAGRVGPAATREPPGWPAATRESRPWSYWWWMGSAVDAGNLTREMELYRAAGWGGLHIIPIYGAKGYEARYIEYLSPQWMRMLKHAVQEGRRLDLGVDMSTGTGWCFGGPNVSRREACVTAVVEVRQLAEGGRLQESFDRDALQALAAFSAEGSYVDLTGMLDSEGKVSWTAGPGAWQVYSVSQQLCRTPVKRAAPGGAGPMLNPFYSAAIGRYLERFAEAFASYDGLLPRAMYHDSFEYGANWSPDLFAEFERRRGYRLQAELPALFGSEVGERTARVKADYRETLSDLMVEHFLPAWVAWCHKRGIRTRNQAHGSPGNLLDLYAAADIPETEMFHLDRSTLVSKLASSAAHVAGKKLVASETGTWLKEHFQETLADLKELVDQLFTAGVNHVIYHGSCYSPDDAPWPGWLFYASTQMNPRNPIWRDVPALNDYITRCQSVLQSGWADNDILLYWPIHDLWHNPTGLNMNLTVHRRAWLEAQPVGAAAQRLWDRGFPFDYVSDRLLAQSEACGGAICTPGGAYRAVAVPGCERMPVATFEKLLALAEAGATVVFERDPPYDVPGLDRLEERRRQLRRLRERLRFVAAGTKDVREARWGRGRILAGDLEAALGHAGVEREPLTDRRGLEFVRRAVADGRYYFLVNRGAEAVEGWIPLATRAASVLLMDPMSGRIGLAASRPALGSRTEVYLRLEPAESVILRTAGRKLNAPAWTYWRPAGPPVAISGAWRVKAVAGGPGLPAPLQTFSLGSWTVQGRDWERFGGTAVYQIEFDAPSGDAEAWYLELGDVRESARIRLNGGDMGTLFLKPYRVLVHELNSRGNVLEIEVTNLAANRIRDLDRRKVAWRLFHDINFVNINYKPFDASHWPVRESGLLGPVTLRPAIRTTW